jgi:hypothetical protein
MYEFFNLQTNRMEAHWYPHKSVNFDQYCHTDEEVFECIDMYITKGLTTADFEAEKYIVFQRYDYVAHICDKYEIKDWTHLFVTAIINRCHINMIIKLITKYQEKVAEHFIADPEQNDVLYSCLSTKNLDAFLIFLGESNLDGKWIDIFDNKDLTATMNAFKAFDLESIKIKRNLVYALMDKDAERAIRLIEAGIEADVWNNFPMRIIITHEELKSNKELVKKMMQKGAKIPSYITETRRFANSITATIKNSFACIPSSKLKKQTVQSTSTMEDMGAIKTKINVHKNDDSCVEIPTDDTDDVDVCITIRTKS